MTAKPATPPQKTRYSQLGYLLAAVKYSFFQAAFLTVLYFLLNQFVLGWAFRLGWWLSPWRSFPMPCPLNTLSTRGMTYPQEPQTWIESTFYILLGVCVHTLLIAAFHALFFSIGVRLYSVFEWPHYRQHVADRINRHAIWLTSVKRCWWVWPVAAGVFLLLSDISMGTSRAHYTLFRPGGIEYPVLILIAISIIVTGKSIQVFREAVIEQIPPEDIQCYQCGYLLRGLTDKRCPECGYAGQQEGFAEYGLRWHRWKRLKTLRRWFMRILLVVLMIYPVFQLILFALPDQWREKIPYDYRPWTAAFSPGRVSYPVYPDVVCLIRHDHSIAVAWFEIETKWRIDYRVAFWQETGDMEQSHFPNTWSRGEISDVPLDNLQIGPWSFGGAFLVDMPGTEPSFFLTPPDDSYTIQAWRPEDLPDEYQWLKNLHPPISLNSQKD